MKGQPRINIAEVVCGKGGHKGEERRNRGTAPEIIRIVRAYARTHTHTHKSFASHNLHSTSSPTLKAFCFTSSSKHAHLGVSTACGNNFGFKPAWGLILPLPLISYVP